MKNLTTKTSFLAALIASSFCLASTASAAGRGNDKPLLTIYVASQGLYYDSFVTKFGLPNKGRFQQLDPGAENGPTTEYGPGDAGYIGGRWWIDTNSDDIRDEGDVYFSCPLLGPGRAEP